MKIEILRLSDPKTDEKIPKMHIVFGHYEGEINAQPGEKVIFIGDCAEYEGQLHGELVQIESTYRDRSGINPREAKAEDIFVKMLKMQRQMSTKKRVQDGEIITLRGCPVSVAEQVLMLVKLGKVKNPYFDPSQAVPFATCYLSWRTRQLINKILGVPKHILNFKERGDAQPSIHHPVGQAEENTYAPHLKGGFEV